MNILGHRGIRQEDVSTPYQNTIEAIDFALKNKVDGIEFDVYASKDGKIFVVHDDDLSIHSTSKKFITKTNSEDIKNINLDKHNSNYKIPSLKEVLTKYNSKILNVEIKQEGITGLVLKEIKKFEKTNDNIYKNVIISSFKHQELKKVRKINKDITIGILFDSDDSKNTDFFAYLTNLINEISGNITLNPNCYVEDERIFNLPYYKYFWTIKKQEIEGGLFKKLAKIPQANFITDYPEILVPLKKELNY